jgi:PEP-CTERM motif
MNTPPNTKTAAFKKLARKLLTTTCLTAAATGAAHATTFTETTDLGNTFLTNTLLPVGTDRVIGTLNGVGDFGVDYFKITGLLAGSNYTLTGSYVGSQFVTVFDSAQGILNAQAHTPPTLSGIVPGDGMLVIAAQNEEGGISYDLSLSSTPNTGTPEPATFGGVGLALAGVAALRSKSKK